MEIELVRASSVGCDEYDSADSFIQEFAGRRWIQSGARRGSDNWRSRGRTTAALYCAYGDGNGFGRLPRAQHGLRENLGGQPISPG
jgi:hypothetical protein